MSGSMARALLAGGLAAAAVLLQGCEVVIPRHEVGNWRKKASYLLEYSFTPPGGEQPQLNSCGDSSMPIAMKCNGHGKCQDWFGIVAPGGAAPAETLSFCQCDQNWADPECGTPRKSQVTAFLLSVFLGMFGADQFYLGYVWPQGILKLFTLGGGGLWWIYDIVRIGSSPVVASDDFRLAADVSHWAYVLTVITVMGVLGFAISIWSINRQRVMKAREIMLLQAECADPDSQPVPLFKTSGPAYSTRPMSASFRGYGTTLQPSMGTPAVFSGPRV